MRNVVAPGAWLGYCTNVHAGATLDATIENLRRYAAPVRDLVCPGETMGVGLWLSDQASRAAAADPSPLHDALESMDLAAFTFNGFPFGDFHQPVVKTAVYEPSWLTDERADYTIRLARILARLAPDGEGSISTLPIGWGFALDEQHAVRAWRGLSAVVDELAAIEDAGGPCIHLDLEPEPGCVIGSHADAASWLRRVLPDGSEGDRVRRHLRICHDVCHAAVMFEDQAAMLSAYRDIGVRIGKVQVSNAIRARITPEAAAQFRSFCEDRYQHQTTCRTADGALAFAADLPGMLALHDAGDPRAAGEWRVHFHVPIGLERFGVLHTTRDMIPQCLDLLRSDVAHWEVETYAWGVLPASLQAPSLAEGIAAELRWLAEVIP